MGHNTGSALRGIASRVGSRSLLTRRARLLSSWLRARRRISCARVTPSAPRFVAARLILRGG
eukprot:COSAG01_NODE_687_length_14245_cov_40.399548_1_plen_61_part_10